MSSPCLADAPPVCRGPDKARYKSRIKTDAVLTALVKKGVDVQGATWAVPKGNAAVQLMQMLDDQILQVHAEHIILPDFFARCSQYARLVGGVQLYVRRAGRLTRPARSWSHSPLIPGQVCGHGRADAHVSLRGAGTPARLLVVATPRSAPASLICVCVWVCLTRRASIPAEVACSAMLIMLGKGIPPSANTKSPLVSFLVASVQDESVAKGGRCRMGCRTPVPY